MKQLICSAAIVAMAYFLAASQAPVHQHSGEDIMNQKHNHTNKLIHETSPYLLQHAHNPVDWYPWGEEALVKAKK